MMIFIEYIRDDQMWRFPRDEISDKSIYVLPSYENEPHYVLEADYVSIPRKDYNLQDLLEAVAVMTNYVAKATYAQGEPVIRIFFDEGHTKFGIIGYDGSKTWIHT